MRVYGLTGGIASGKSTVSAMFVAQGIPVLDADQVARSLVEPGQPALEEVVKAFGSAILHPDGSLNRDHLGTLIFRDATARATLNAIIHPRVRSTMAEEIGRLATQGTPLAMMDIPLLYEARDPADFAGVVVVWVSPATQLSRLMARNSLSDDDARARISSQMSLDEKAKRATYIIDNEGNLDETRTQVELLVAHLRHIDEE